MTSRGFRFLGRRAGRLGTHHANAGRGFNPQSDSPLRCANHRNDDVFAELDHLRRFAGQDEHGMNLSRFAAISGRANLTPRRGTRESFTVHCRTNAE